MRGPDDQHQTRTGVRAGTTAVAARGLKLEVLRGPDAGVAQTLATHVAVVGRAEAADLRLRDRTVSALHVELRAQDDGVRVTDLASRNGVFAHGVRILTAVVPSGTSLELGGSVLRVQIDAALPDAGARAVSFGELHGRSPVMRELFGALAQLARTDLALLIEAPTGAGKELAARAVHEASPFARGPFVVLDCTSIPTALAESVLFGHEKGAFTGAIDARPGVFEAADGGTVFLDEVGDLPAELQPKLLRVLERREVVRVGARLPRSLRFRAISATWRDLRAMVNQGTFREDLFFRLVQARVEIPPLAARGDDVALLAAHFVERRAPDAPGARGIAPDALETLCRREFPGNVRELRSLVERAAALAEGPVVSAADLTIAQRFAATLHHRDAPAPPDDDTALAPFKTAKRDVIDDFEREYLRRLLVRAGNRLGHAAELAGLERHSMRDLLRRHGLRSLDGG